MKKEVSLSRMNRGQPFWKQPTGIVVLGLGGVMLLATGWMAFSRLGPSPSSTEAYAPAKRIDENALVAANAERPGGTAPAATPSTNAVEASADDAPAGAEAAEPASDKPDEGRFDPDEILGEAERAIEEAAEAVEEAVEGTDDKPNQ